MSNNYSNVARFPPPLEVGVSSSQFMENNTRQIQFDLQMIRELTVDQRCVKRYLDDLEKKIQELIQRKDTKELK